MPLPKTLFLDFDGVLHPTSARTRHAYFSCAGFLADALGTSRVEIVISSSWRFEHTCQAIKGMLPGALADHL